MAIFRNPVSNRQRPEPSYALLVLNVESSSLNMHRDLRITDCCIVYEIGHMCKGSSLLGDPRIP